MNLQTEHHVYDGIDLITVNGDIDFYTAPQLRERLHQLLEGAQAKDVVIDLSGVPFMDSMALGVLMGGLKRARSAGGTVRLAGPNALATKVLRVTGLVKVFRIYSTVEDALADPFELPSGQLLAC